MANLYVSSHRVLFLILAGLMLSAAGLQNAPARCAADHVTVAPQADDNTLKLRLTQPVKNVDLDKVTRALTSEKAYGVTQVVYDAQSHTFTITYTADVRMSRMIVAVFAKLGYEVTLAS